MACGSRRPAGGGLRCGHGCLQWGGAGGGVVASRARSTPLYTRPRPRRWSNGSPSPRHARASPSYRARPPLPQRWGGSHGAPARLRLDAASAWLLTRGGLAESPWSSSSAKKKSFRDQNKRRPPPGGLPTRSRRHRQTNTSSRQKERHTGHAQTPARTTQEKHPHMRGARLVGSDTQTGGDERGSCGGGGSGSGALRFLSAQRGALCRPGCGRQGGA